MKLFAFLLLATSAVAQGPIARTWLGYATVHGQQVPIRLEITGDASDQSESMLSTNGPLLVMWARACVHELIVVLIGLAG